MVDAGMLSRVSALIEQFGKDLGGLDGSRVILRCSDYDAARMQIVVQSFTFAEKFRTEDDAIIVAGFS